MNKKFNNLKDKLQNYKFYDFLYSNNLIYKFLDI